MSNEIFYELEGIAYANLTNKCCCACDFCIRKSRNSVGSATNLWLSKEPTLKDIITELNAFGLEKYNELVFCGYGEPTEALELLLETARYAKTLPGCPPLRLNTNGLSDLIHGEPTAHLLEGLLDTVSISLNAGTEAAYMAVTRPKWNNAFAAMQQFAVDCKQYVPKIMFTVVDVIPQEEIDAAQALADKLGIPLRVRKYDS